MPDLRLTPIDGGWHVKVRDDGLYCIDIMEMLVNYRIVISPVDSDHQIYAHGWCYFGHGVDETGAVRTMPTAYLAAVAAAMVWDGYGSPPGFDKQAC